MKKEAILIGKYKNDDGTFGEWHKVKKELSSESEIWVKAVLDGTSSKEKLDKLNEIKKKYEKYVDISMVKPANSPKFNEFGVYVGNWNNKKCRIKIGKYVLLDDDYKKLREFKGNWIN